MYGTVQPNSRCVLVFSDQNFIENYYYVNFRLKYFIINEFLFVLSFNIINVSGFVFSASRLVSMEWHG